MRVRWGGRRRHRGGRVLAVLTLALIGCSGGTAAGTATTTARPLGTANLATQSARAATLAATVTSVARGTPQPATPTFQPAMPNPVIAATASVPIGTPRPTNPANPVVRDGTPRSLPGIDGEYLVVSGHRMWIACRGEGGPTVIMEAGVNSGSNAWTLVLPRVAVFARVCVYDRANTGKSDPAPKPRTSQDVVDDLHALLDAANVPGPYLFVAHSYGGLNVRLYAGQYPQEVVGMILVDTVHEDRFAATAKVLTPEQEREFEQGRQMNPEGLDYNESSRLVRNLGKPLPNIPVVIIARGRSEAWPKGYPSDQLEAVWRQLQTDLASRAPQGQLLIAAGSDHNIPGEQPGLIATTVMQMLDTLRHP